MKTKLILPVMLVFIASLAYGKVKHPEPLQKTDSLYDIELNGCNS